MDEDFDNYSGEEEFNEDSLSNEEYDTLYAALPQVKAELASYNPQIEDIDIKEALYYNYFEIAAAIEELKSKFPKKKDDSVQPKMSKLAMLAKSRAGAGALSSVGQKSAQNGPNLANLSSKPEGSAPRKLTGLAALAKTRAAKSGVKSGDFEREMPGLVSKSGLNEGSKLSALASAKSKGISALGQLKVKCNDTATGGDKIQLSRRANGGGVDLRRKLENAKKTHQSGSSQETDPKTVADSEINQDENADLMDVDSKSVSTDPVHGTKRSAPQISFELSTDLSGILRHPQKCVSVLLFENSPTKSANTDLLSKRRRLSSQLFRAYTNREPDIAKAKSNFSSPSPDDKVLNAQKQAFEQSVKELSLNEKTPQKSEPKPVKKTETKPFKKIDIQQELAQNAHFAKPSASFVIIGHVDAGKSTLMGRILYDLGTVDAKTVNKLVREAEKSGKGSFALAWVMDQTAEERSRGVTIDICATTFETEKVRFTAIDAPGHKDFVPQMIGGVSQADTALLVVDAITGEFEAGFLMDGQTKEHAIIARNLGITNLCVAVNKLDKENWSEARFADIQEQLTQYLTSEEIGFSQTDMSFVPISGLTGCNVVKNDKNVAEFAWYKGPTLIERLEQVSESQNTKPTDSMFEREFNLAINDIYDVTNSEFKVKGKVSSGTVQAGETVVIHPTEDQIQVQALQINSEKADFAVEGQIVSMTFKVQQLKNKSTDDLAIGDIASSVKAAVRSVTEFHAHINTFNMTKPLLVGTPFVLFRNNASVAARVTKVVSTEGKKKKKHLMSRQTAEVIIEILEDRKLPVARFEDNKALGRVVLRREGVTIGAGVITQVE
ncbi:hypothetical protein OXX59_005250 [Metschnikowia pulcherrima]